MKIYRGIVVDNKDPNGGGRVKVRIAGVHPLPKNFGDGNYETKDGEDKGGEETFTDDGLPWAEVMQPIGFIGFGKACPDGKETCSSEIDGSKKPEGGKKSIERTGDRYAGYGSNIIIDVGVWVFLVLDNDDPQYPIVIGTVSAYSEHAERSKPGCPRIYNSKKGHYEEWSDEKNSILIHHSTGSEINFDDNGTVRVDAINDHKTAIMNNRAEAIAGTSKIYVEGDITEYTNSTGLYEAKNKLTIKVNSSTIIVEPSTIKIYASSQIDVTCGGPINVKGSVINLN